jgi:hypothetical protein
VGREVLILRGREERLQVVERGGMLCLDMQRVQVNLKVDLSAQPKHKTLLQSAYLLYSGPQEAAHKELEPLQLRLDDDQLEVRLWVHVARLVLNQLDLPTPLARRQTAMLVAQGPASRCQHTCRRIRSSTRSMRSLGHGSISGATRSATQHRVSSCRSRVSRGVASTATSARRSSISMVRRRTPGRESVAVECEVPMRRCP